ncbi:uncharacterized protein [Macaca nemestrina]|uniref:uncharacterized protein n=1 Tax=Macaca nemestrina TaxID=9545 RepID=UPI0039B85CAE
MYTKHGIGIAHLLIIPVGLKCHHKCFYNREAKRDQTPNREQGDMEMKTKIELKRPQAKECQQLPEAGRAKEQFLALELRTFLAERRRGFLLQQCLDGTRRSSPILAGRPQPALRHPFTASSDRPKAPAAAPAPRSHRRRRRRRLSLASAMTTTSTSQVRQNYHQDSEAVINCQINLELYASYVYLSMSYYFVFFVFVFVFVFLLYFKF